ncbi:ABC multidrug transporter B [Trichoderma asperellum]|uniref:ABC multidrug transporter B n=1 Tax=Trichoderma asperellum TaxID=101201 RepID=A0A6V8R041_TRIAP|nr:ABC multidrug transporter B [Trichoderma asperellum]
MAQQPSQPIGIALPALQTAVAVMSGGALILFEVFSNFKVHASRKKAGPVHVNEPGSGIFGMLFFGWLWPLLRYGHKNTIAISDLEPAIARSTAKFNLGSNWMSTMEDERKFLCGVALPFISAVIIQILSAGATLAQPFIVQGIVTYLQNEQNKSIGIWLVIAMVFDQLAISVLEAHGSHAFNQLSFKTRSFLIHRIALRGLGGSPPAGGWKTAGNRVIVHVSQDSAAIAGAVQLLGMIIPNILVIGIGSYMLFRLIHLAFLGPLLAAIACTLLPTLLAGPLSRSEHRLLQATELRIAKSQATDNRRQEIEAAGTFRRILTVVIVAAVFLSSLATLAAFGGFSLSPQHNLDYGILFTSLSTMQIMLTPLLSIIQMLPEFVSSLVSWKRLVYYVKINEEDLPSSKSPQDLAFISEKPTSPQNTLVKMVNLTAKTGETLLTMEDMTAEWASGSAFIEHANLSLGMGRMAIVAGAAGSGKSSILKAILGESTVVKGRLTVSAHRLSLCDQMLWFIPELSIKENIVFGKPFDQHLYNRVVACCCLDRDLRALDGGDGTRLSITGSPLSGGQRRRVSLARTLYDSGDLFLLDDIFNGLDAKTRATVATNVFGTNGFIQEIGAAAILVCAEPPWIMSSFPCIEFYMIQNSHLNVVDKSTFAENEIKDARHQGSKSAIAATTTKVSSFDGVEGRQSALAEEEVVVDDFLSREKAKTWEAHLIYFKSLGSPIIVAIAGMFLFAWAGTDRAGSFWLSHWASQYSNLGHGVENGYYVGIYVAFSVAGVLAMFISVWITFMRIVPESSINLHRDMLSVLVKSPAYAVEQHKSENLNRFTNDIEAVDLHLPQSLQNLITSIASCIGSIVVIGVGSPYTMISLPILLPLIFILQKFYLKTSFQLRSLQVAAQAPMLQMVGAILEGRVTIRAFNQNQYMARLMSDCINRGLMMGYLFKSVQIWVTLMLGLVNGCLAIALASLLISLGGSNSITWGGLALVNVIRLGQDAMLLLTWWTRFESTMACMDRICDYTQRTPQERVQIPEAPVDCAWPEHGRIQVKNLSLAHQSRRVIKDLNIDIPAGSKVAILGRTGSGKTSLLQAFFKLIRCTGGILEVDGINIFSVSSDLVQSRLVGHSQSFVADSSATHLLSSLAPPQIAGDIMSRLDSRWNECNFSDGGQRIIGLARTLLRDSAVYVMDEPTSGMDEQSHASAMKALFSILSNKTVITTTHTLVGITIYDLKLLPSRSTGTGLAVPVPTVITPIVICFVFKVEDLEIGWQKIACKMTDGDSKAIHISTKGEAAAAIWNKRQSWDLTQ